MMAKCQEIIYTKNLCYGNISNRLESVTLTWKTIYQKHCQTLRGSTKNYYKYLDLKTFCYEKYKFRKTKVKIF